MHTYARKPKTAQSVASARTMTSVGLHFSQNRDEMYAILHAQQTTENQAERRWLPRVNSAAIEKAPLYIATKIKNPVPCGVQRSGIEVSMPGDPDEKEADRLADMVMRAMPPAEARKSDVGVERGSAGEGHPLTMSERHFFEPRFGVEFSSVRLHTDSASARQADALQARAFTYGNAITFGSAAYQPGSNSGKWLMAHELAHVLQQRNRRNRIFRWSKTGVQSALCPSRDRWVVARLNSMDVYEFIKIERHWDKYHKTKAGGKGAFAEHVFYEVDGLASPPGTPPPQKVWIKKSLSDKEAAATCFHEVTHTGQPAAMALLNAEYDAWIQEEYFRIRHGMPEAITGSRFKAGGIMVADVNRVKAGVRALYQHRDPSSPFVWEFDKQVPTGVKKVSGWACPAAPVGMPAYYGKSPRAVIRVGANPRLRAIRTSGANRGFIYLTSQSLTAGTQVTVLQDAVNRIDYDATNKPMVEILHNERNYWIPAGDIQYP